MISTASGSRKSFSASGRGELTLVATEVGSISRASQEAHEGNDYPTTRAGSEVWVVGIRKHESHTLNRVVSRLFFEWVLHMLRDVSGATKLGAKLGAEFLRELHSGCRYYSICRVVCNPSECVATRIQRHAGLATALFRRKILWPRCCYNARSINNTMQPDWGCGTRTCDAANPVTELCTDVTFHSPIQTIARGEIAGTFLTADVRSPMYYD